jgi:DNA invertase Pin-like site-specific DNA recombinase
MNQTTSRRQSKRSKDEDAVDPVITVKVIFDRPDVVGEASTAGMKRFGASVVCQARALPRAERELVRVRTGEGRVRAKARGVHMGRPFKLNPHQRREALARREAEEALTDIARSFGVHHTTIGRLRV